MRLRIGDGREAGGLRVRLRNGEDPLRLSGQEIREVPGTALGHA